jgi:hypothetical protein
MSERDTKQPDEMLDELAELGMSAVRTLARRASTVESAEEFVALSEAFERAALDVLRTIAMRHGIQLEDLIELEEAFEAEWSWPTLPPASRPGPLQ